MAYTSKYKVEENNNTWLIFLAYGANAIGYKRGKQNDKLVNRIKKGTLIFGDITGHGIVYAATVTEDLYLTENNIFGADFPWFAGIKIHWIVSPENAIPYDALGISNGHQQNLTLGGGRKFHLSWAKRAIRILKNRHQPELLEMDVLVPEPLPLEPAVVEPVIIEVQDNPQERERERVRAQTLRITAIAVRMLFALNRDVSIPNNDRTESLQGGYLTQNEIERMRLWDRDLPAIDIISYAQDGGIAELFEIENSTQMWTGFQRILRVVNTGRYGNVRTLIFAPEQRRAHFQLQAHAHREINWEFVSFTELENIVAMDIERYPSISSLLNQDNVRRHSNRIIINELTTSYEQAIEIIRQRYGA